MTSTDLLIKDATIVTVDGERRIIDRGFIRISRGIIEQVSAGSISSKLSSDIVVIDASGRLVFPGLINTHTHIFQTLLRGIGQDLPVWEWFAVALDTTVGHLTLEDCYLSALVGSLEAIKSGTTCVLDYNYPHPLPKMADQTIRAFSEIGIRGILARGIIDTGEAHKSIVQSTEAEINDCERLIKTYHCQGDGMIHVWLAPYTIFSTSVDGFKRAKDLADKYNTRLTVHAATPSTIQAAEELYGVGDLQHEENIGFLGPNLLAVHCTTGIRQESLEQLSKWGVQVSHNPASNAYLGEGIAPVRDMLDSGIKVCLGTDGPASNNNMDMIETLKLAALMQKVDALDPAAISAQKVLEMATIDAAHCIGQSDTIGSIEVGKKADLMIVDPWKPNSIALHDPVASLVYSCTQENVDTVIVNGNVIMKDRVVETVSEHSILFQAQKAAEELWQRAGISFSSRYQRYVKPA